MKRIIFTAVWAFATCLFATGFSSQAQTVTKSNEFSSFTGIEASDNFDIVIKEGTPRVEWIVDEAVEDLAQIYQKGSTLVLSFDRKNMTKEQKNRYKGKNAPAMVLKATVYIQSLESLSLKGGVKADASDASFSTKSFALTMDDDALINSLNITASNVTVEVSGKAIANLTIASSDKVIVKGNRKAIVSASLEGCKELTINADGSASLSVSGSAGVINVQNAGSAKVNISNGKCPRLGLSSKNSAELDVTAYSLDKADVAMVGGKAFLNVTKVLKLDIKNSHVSFMSDPAIEIVKIEKATVTHFSGKSK